MSGPLAHDAEVFGGFDDAGSEELIPHAIYGHASGERICGAHGPLGQSKAVVRFARWQRRQKVRSIGLYPLSASGVNAARQHMRVGERRLLPRNLRQIATGGEPVKLAYRVEQSRAELPDRKDPRD